MKQNLENQIMGKENQIYFDADSQQLSGYLEEMLNEAMAGKGDLSAQLGEDFSEAMSS